MRVWIESGGDTGGAEVYTDPEAKVARIDWDDWKDGERDWDQIFYWLEEFGDLMPRQTRKTLLTTLMPDEEA